MFRYVRCLGALYLRLIGTAVDVYQFLEPLYSDFRRIKVRNATGRTCFRFSARLHAGYSNLMR
jgi:hypothetical protein